VRSITNQGKTLNDLLGADGKFQRLLLQKTQVEAQAVEAYTAERFLEAATCYAALAAVCESLYERRREIRELRLPLEVSREHQFRLGFAGS
jgi:hypothetical protein